MGKLQPLGPDKLNLRRRNAKGCHGWKKQDFSLTYPCVNRHHSNHLIECTNVGNYTSNAKIIALETIQ